MTLKCGYKSRKEKRSVSPNIERQCSNADTDDNNKLSLLFQVKHGLQTAWATRKNRYEGHVVRMRLWTRNSHSQQISMSSGLLWAMNIYQKGDEQRIVRRHMVMKVNGIESES